MSYFDALPSEMKWHIISMLNTRDLANLRLASRAFHPYICFRGPSGILFQYTPNKVCEAIKVDQQEATMNQVKILKRTSSASDAAVRMSTEIAKQGHVYKPKTANQWDPSVRIVKDPIYFVETMTLRESDLPTAELFDMLCIDRLKQLSLATKSTNPARLVRILTKFPNIETLGMSGVYSYMDPLKLGVFTRIITHFPQLRKLTIKHYNLTAANCKELSSCFSFLKQLEDLSVVNCRLDDSDAAVLVQQSRLVYLKRLNLSSNCLHKLTAYALVLSAINLSRLEMLELQYNSMAVREQGLVKAAFGGKVSIDLSWNSSAPENLVVQDEGVEIGWV